MAVPSLPLKMSDITTEFGAGSFATRYVADIGALPGSMSEYAGLSDFVTISSATLTADHDSASCASAGDCNPGGANCTLSPVVTDGDPSTRTYLWTKNSGDAPDGSLTAATVSYSIPGQLLSDGQSVNKSGNFSVKVTDSTGFETSNSVSMSATIQNDGPS